MENSNLHPIFENLCSILSPTKTDPFEKLAEKHYDIWVPNNEEACEKEHAMISVKFAIESIEDIILAASGPTDVFAQLQIKINALRLLIKL